MKLVCISNLNKYNHKLAKLEIGKVYDIYDPPGTLDPNTWDNVYTHIYIMIEDSPLAYPKSVFIPLEEYRESRLKLII